MPQSFITLSERDLDLGGLLNPKLGIDCETDRESGSGQSSDRRGGNITLALHLEVVYKIRWLQ